MLDTIKAALRGAGLTVYDAAEKINECRAPYVVAYDHGVSEQPGTKGLLGRRVYEIVALVPYADTDGLPKLEKQVRETLRGIPSLRFSSSGGTGVEETFKARACALTYTHMTRL